jgi:3-deoxy-D-manno-octulosonic-acid transferase
MIYDKSYRPHWQERFSRGIPPTSWKNAEQKIWVHAVSLGETRAITPLILKLALRHPKAQFLLTHSTPNGRLSSEQHLSPILNQRLTIRYFPYDLPWFMRVFVKTWAPSICLLTETELWPHHLFATRRYRIPTFLMSARLSRRSARRYARFGYLATLIIRQLSGIWAQDIPTIRRFKTLGYTGNYSILGNLKFDPIPPSLQQLQLGEQLANAWEGNPLRLILASSRPEEEQAFLTALPPPSSLAFHLAITIVPRHIERCEEIALFAQQRGWTVQRKSHWAGETLNPKTTLLLGDTMGELHAYYKGNTIALLGGSFASYGAQNPLEALAAGCLLYVGPSRFNFQIILHAALRKKAIISVESMNEAIEHILSLSPSDSLIPETQRLGQLFFSSQQGIIEAYLHHIKAILTN